MFFNNLTIYQMDYVLLCAIRLQRSKKIEIRENRDAYCSSYSSTCRFKGNTK